MLNMSLINKNKNLLRSKSLIWANWKNQEQKKEPLSGHPNRKWNTRKTFSIYGWNFNNLSMKNVKKF
jgi:hypothetical protein